MEDGAPEEAEAMANASESPNLRLAAQPQPMVYERNINVKVMDQDNGQFYVQASLFDLEHSFQAEMLVDVATGRIEDAAAVMSKRPYPTYCLRALDNVAKLKGQVIGRGINRKVVELLGRDTGCVHLVEIFLSAVGFTATILIGKRAGRVGVAGMGEEEDRKAWFPILRNSCQVFREENSNPGKS
jgi:hypothetical protein